MDNLNKSLQALDAAADELLRKSAAGDDDKDDVKPDDVADDSGDTDDEDNTDDTDEVKKCDSPDGDNVKKSDDCDDADVQKSEDEDDEEDEDNVSKSLEDAQQSVEDDFRSDPDIIKGIENSEFNAAMIATLVKSLGEIQYDMSQNRKSADDATSIMAKSLQASLSTNQKLIADNERLLRRVNKLEKSFNQGIEKLLDAIDTVSTEPAHTRKSVNSISIHDKDFQKSLGSNSVGGFESLSKSQVIGVLTNELYSGNTLVTPQAVIGFESGAPLSPELKALVVSKCKA